MASRHGRGGRRGGHRRRHPGQSINTATNTPGKPIHVRGGATGGIAITP